MGESLRGCNFLACLLFQRHMGSAFGRVFCSDFHFPIPNTFSLLKSNVMLLHSPSHKDLNVIVFWALLFSGSVMVLEITLCVLLRAITSPLVGSRTSCSKKQLLKMSRNCFLNLVPIWYMASLYTDSWSPPLLLFY